LAQDEEAMEQVLDQVAAPLEDATDDTLQLFSPRYDPQEGWGLERFDQIVTRGCFPLHPLTTALFCSVSFGEVQSERSVLNFVLTELERKLDQPAVIDGKPNWIYAEALVSWFNQMLGETEYLEY